MEEKLLGGQYRLLEEIGRGGFGAVYRASKVDSEGSGAVAIKLLNKTSALRAEEYLRFQKEAVIMCQFAHPGVVAVYELGEDAGCYFIVMEYIKGTNLRSFVKARGGRLQLIEILDILCQAAEALDYVHSFQIIHRDIKPQNILICENSAEQDAGVQVKLVDFGVARIATATDEHINEVVGTYAYMSPEATGLVSIPPSPASDVYSFGIVAFELFTGRVPFSEKTPELTMKAHVEAIAPSLAEARGSEFPSILEIIVAKCLAKNPAERYQSFFALSSDLRRLISNLKRNMPLSEFEIGMKDLGIQEKMSSLFVGRQALLQNIFEFVRSGVEPLRKRLSWGVLCGGVGVGKSKILQKALEGFGKSEISSLAVRFTESERKLAFQSLVVSIEETLQAWSMSQPDTYRSFLTLLSTTEPRCLIALGQLFQSLQPLASKFDSASSSGGALAEFRRDLERILKTSDPQEIDEFTSQEREQLAALYFGLADLMQAFSAIKGHTIFVFDDMHLADPHSLRFFRFMAQHFNGNVAFSMLLSLRLPMLGLLEDLRALRRRVRIWEVPEFGLDEVKEYLEEIGLDDWDESFLNRFFALTQGVPLQVNRLARRLMSEDIFFFRRGDKAKLVVDSYEWENFENKAQSVEVLVANVSNLTSNAKTVLSVLAVAAEAYSYEMLKIEGLREGKSFDKSLELLVRQGYVLSSGDKIAPLQRRFFSVFHEKIRKEVMASNDPTFLKWTHLRLAEHLETLYRGVKKDVLLKIARHYDCAGDVAQAENAADAFVRAVRIYVKDHDTLSARHFISRTVSVCRNISDPQLRNRRLREVYEAEYSIYASLGQFVRASEVCQQLIALTEDDKKRSVLKVFWGQLLIGIGQHLAGHNQVTDVLAHFKVLEKDQKGKLAERIFSALHLGEGFEVFKNVSLLRKEPLGSLEVQALTLKMLAELHGVEGDPRDSLSTAARHGVSQHLDGKWSAVFSCLEASQRLNLGQTKVALGQFETALRYLKAKGHNDGLRLAQCLKAIWIDYPMGRLDRVHKILEPRHSHLLPSSGLLHFESAGLKSWIALLSPSSEVGKMLRQSEGRRRSDRLPAEASLRDPQSKYGGPVVGGLLASQHGARRILDASENHQFTSLALFSDAFRQALSGRMEPLQRASRQFLRQKNSSHLGLCFQHFTASLLELLSGRFGESLKSYDAAIQALCSTPNVTLSAPICDAIKLAAVALPLCSVGVGARGWPWGAKLLSRLEKIDNKLTEMNGPKAPNRSSVHALFLGVAHYMGGDRKKSFDRLDKALEESRAQRSELVETLAFLCLGVFCGQLREARATEHFENVVALCEKWEWEHLKSISKGIAERLRLDISEGPLLPELPSRSSPVSLESLQLGSLFSKLDSYREPSHMLELKREIARLALEISEAQYCFLILAKGDSIDFAIDHDLIDVDMSQKSGDLRALFSLFLSTSEKATTLLPFEFSTLLAHLEKSSVKLTEKLTKEGSTHGGPWLTRERSRIVFEPRTRQQGSLALSMAPGVLTGEESTVQWEDEPTAALQLSSVRFADSEQETAQGDTVQNREEITQTKGVPFDLPSGRNFLCVVPLAAGSQVLGWFVLPGVVHAHFQERDSLSELSVLGLHAGYLFESLRLRNSPQSLPPLPFVGHGVLPTRMRSENLKISSDLTLGSCVEVKDRQLRGTSWHGLHAKGLVLYHWELRADEKSKTKQFAGLLSRHLEFLVRSFEARKESPFSHAKHFARLGDRIVAEISMLTQIFDATRFVNEFHLHLLVVDAESNRAVEVRLGRPAFVSTGAEHIVDEATVEIGRGLSGDKWLVSVRQIAVQGPVAWLLCLNDAAWNLVGQFTSSHFLDSALAGSEKSASPLTDALQRDGLFPLAEGVCFFLDAPESDEV